MDTSRLRGLIREKGGDVVQPSPEWLEKFSTVATHDDVRQYLEFCVPKEGFVASGVTVKDLEGIEEENLSGASPGLYIFPHGYLVIATSVGGNAICIHGRSGRVVWADHSSFSDVGISYKDQRSGDWVDLPMMAENVPKAMPVLSEDLEAFLGELLTDRLEETIDRLD